MNIGVGIKGPSLNIGCKETRLGDVNIDVDKDIHPDIVADVLHLPFKNNIFNLVYFTDVIEHLPENSEINALNEIYRVLKPNGYLILTTPNDRIIYTYLDPAKYIVNHRHYKIKDILKIVKNTNFKIEKIFTSGGFWELLGVLFYCFFTYPIMKIFNVKLPYAPDIIITKIDSEYNVIKTDNGYTIFVIMKKM